MTLLEGAQHSSHLVDVRPGVMTVSGWYDATLYGALHVYQAVERSSPKP
jgi:hypothetical protein